MVMAFDIKDNLKGVAKDGKNIILACFLIIFLLATWKYVKDGETYEFQTPTTENFIDLNGSVVSQEIIIDELADWKDRSYAVYFHLSAGANVKETIHLELSQNGEVVDSADVNVGWLIEGFNELKWLNFSRLDAGSYDLSISGELGMPLCVELCDNTFNIPNCYVNGEDTGCTLVQKYHYNYINKPYKIGIALFIALFLLCAITFWYCGTKKEDAAGVLRICLIATYFILSYIYDSTIFFQPLGWEATTNFMHNSINHVWWRCLHITDAGYLPLIQRLISIFVFNFLNITPYIGIFVLQISANLLTGIIISFFAKKQFSNVLDIRYRWALSIILITSLMNSETQIFISFIVYGVYIFFLYFLVDSSVWSKGEFFIICAWVFMQCLSKGVNVTLFPFCVLCLLLFYKNYSKRDKIFLISCGSGAMLQLIYYFTYGIHYVAVDWFDRPNDIGSEFYHLKLLLGMLVDTPNWLLSIPLADKVTLLNGISFPIIIVFWAFVVYLFVKEVVLKMLRKEQVKRSVLLIFMLLIFIMAQSLFLRLTVMGVDKSRIVSDAFWTFKYLGHNRHTLHICLAVITLMVAALQLAEKWLTNRKNLLLWGLLILTVCISNSRLQPKGVGNDDYSRSTIALTTSVSEASLLKDIQNAECRVVPMTTSWKYSKNATVYCVGSDVNKWAAGVIESEEPKNGSVFLSNYANVDTSVPIWQVFITKNCLVDAEEYSVILRDDQGNELLRQGQDNTKYQLLTSFTFEKGVGNVSNIQIVDGNGDSVWLDNTMYIVTKSGENLIK